MRTYFTLIFILLICSQLPSQDLRSGQQSSGASGFSGLSINTSFGHDILNKFLSGTYESTRLEYENIKGTPYLHESPIKGELVLNDGSEIRDLLLLVDLYANAVIAIDQNEMVLNNKHIWSISLPIEDKTIVLKRLNPSKPNKFYIELFDNGEFTFFKEEFTTLREGSNYGLSKVEPKFKRHTQYYMKTKDGSISKVNLNKKEIFSTFPKSEAKLMMMKAKENRNKLKKEEDFIRVFNSVKETSQE